jgi:aminoglycoside 3'-phosphotransferase I
VVFNLQADFSPDLVVMHGDFSLENIMIEDGRVVGCIYVVRAGVADRYQDLALLWNGLGEFGEGFQQRLFESYGLDHPDDRKLRFHIALDELF